MTEIMGNAIDTPIYLKDWQKRINWNLILSYIAIISNIWLLGSVNKNLVPIRGSLLPHPLMRKDANAYPAMSLLLLLFNRTILKCRFEQQRNLQTKKPTVLRVGFFLGGFVSVYKKDAAQAMLCVISRPKSCSSFGCLV